MSDFISFDADGMKDDIEAVNRNLDFAAALVAESTKNAMTEIAKDMIAQAQINLETQTRSGDLSRSAYVSDAVIVDGEVLIAAGFTARYAAQRDQGGTILPKNGSMLAIPLEPVLTGAGVARYDSPLRDEGAPNGLFLVRLWGKLYLAQMLGPGHIEFRWLLVPSVTQEGSHFFTLVINERAAHVGAVAAQLVKDDLNGRSAA